jgi:hypothetical protein
MVDEIQKLWEFIDTNNMSIRARYIRSAANVWADRLMRETYKDDWQLKPRIFTYLDSKWGPHSIDRFATQGNSQLPRYNSRWPNSTSEAADSLYLTDSLWTPETNSCNPAPAGGAAAAAPEGVRSHARRHLLTSPWWARETP